MISNNTFGQSVASKLARRELMEKLGAWLLETQQPIPEELTEWFDAASRTLEWGGFTAFDTVTVNSILARAYLARQRTEKSLPPLRGSVQISSEFRADLLGYRFGAPQLYIERSGFDQPRMQLKMPLIQGTCLHYNVQGQTPRVTAISHVSPLNADLLEADTVLGTSKATASGNQLSLNLGASTNGVLQTPGPLATREAIGGWLVDQLGQFTEDQRNLALLSVLATGSSDLRPLALEAITQPSLEGNGHGAVVGFIGMEGDMPGRLPTAQDIADGFWTYPLGRSGEQGVAIEVLNAGLVVGKLAIRGLSEPLSGDYAQVTPGMAFSPTVLKRPGGGWVASYPAGAYADFVMHRSLSASPEGFTGFTVNAPLSYAPSASGYEAGNFTVVYDPDQHAILVRWQHVDTGGWWVEVSNNNDVRQFQPAVTFNGSWTYQVAVEDGCLVVSAGDSSLEWQVSEQDRQKPWLMGVLAAAFEEIKSIYTACISNSLGQLRDAPLDNIRFGENTALNPTDARLLQDLVIYGHAGGQDPADEFLISPLETVVPVGGQIRFDAGSAVDVNWGVNALGDYQGDIGEITPDGVYTAPGFLGGADMQIRVTAAANGKTSYALITVFSRAVALSPVVQLAYARSTNRYFIRAGGLAGWRWDTTGLKGRLEKPEAAVGEWFLNNEMQYIPPAADAFDGKWLIEEIPVTAGNVTAKGYVLVLKGDELEVRVKSFDGGGGATLAAYAPNGTELDLVRWTKLAGDGRLEGSRVSGEGDGEAPFIVVEAVELQSGFELSGYLLLPLPLSLHMASQASEPWHVAKPSLPAGLPPSTRDDPVAPNASVSASIDPRYFAQNEDDAPFEDDTLLVDQWSASGLDVVVEWAVGGFGDVLIELYASMGATEELWGYVERKPAAGRTQTIVVPPSLMKPDGIYRVWAKVTIAGTEPALSPPVTLRIDTQPPSLNQAPQSPVPKTFVVTQDYLDNNSGKLSLVIPSYDGFSPGDICELYLEESPLPATDMAPAKVPLDRFRTNDDDTTYLLDGDKLVANADGHWNLTYVLYDKAGNASPESRSARLTFLWKPLPQGLLTPEVPVANPSVDLLVLRQGVVATFEQYTSWQPGDQAILSVAGRALEPVTLSDGIGGYFASISIPASLLVDVWADSDTAMQVEISYVVQRLGWKSASSPIGTFTLDLRTAGPENPNLPDPVNPLYNLVDVRGPSGFDNVLEASDAGQDAIVYLDLYNDPAVGDELVFYWAGLEFHRAILTAADIAAGTLTIGLGWPLISPFAGGSDVEIYYTALPLGLSEGNLQYSGTQLVDVSALPFVALSLSFPDAENFEFGDITYRRLFCRSRYQDPTTFRWYVRVAVPDLSQPPYSQRPGDIISLYWQSANGVPDYSLVVDIPEEDNGVFTEDRTLTEEDLNGFDWLVPYDPYCTAIFNYQPDIADGMIKAWYSVESGGRQLKSAPTDDVITSFYTAGGPCDAMVRGISTPAMCPKDPI
ncbi:MULTISPECIES: hypothetical protein [unclassified Pseudomonas]|uniref:hypothetical protein n=1 Tax=unclassified Pseudomonas TaxID=196821 RepID=UPI000BDA3FA9|nr:MULTISPECIES: hypothetical protein [unclassified Pseudomonas]PVZ16421.1 hypothetical protein F474_01941 [Pseudomonas sp. URIL14HWK12:I12]PVZ25723.1 hypothetical protein F470_01169 [Pseudomonas sp. URIL14HWK12:I10]PVZ36753.1 hypothetical protein F472_01941 [Pseudomonas sp. URIL14HWK12:I11]SNZ12682.1 hypothetical protein SAMN05660463_02146 [Pseudomonas sp. URIL14HWK12:I9]